MSLIYIMLSKFSKKKTNIMKKWVKDMNKQLTEYKIQMEGRMF